MPISRFLAALACVFAVSASFAQNLPAHTARPEAAAADAAKVAIPNAARREIDPLATGSPLPP